MPTNANLRFHRLAAFPIVVVAAGTLAAAPAQPSTAARQGEVLKFGILFSPFNVIDVPPLQQHPGDYRPGDYTVFSDTLTDRSGKAVGTEGGTGVITKVDATGAQISYTVSIQLPGGQITGQGLGSPDPHKQLAVTGGTGRYVDAAGQVDVIENGDGTGSLTISLR
jgi:hypothetical protein